MHDEPIAHLYTNKRMRIRVSTSNNRRFICTVRRDASVHELAEAVLERYNSLISDRMHRYFKEGFTATRIYNLRQRSFYLSRTDYVGDLLNDDDEVECDVEELGRKQLKKIIKQEKSSRLEACPEVEQVQPGSEFDQEKQEAQERRRKRSHKKKQKLLALRQRMQDQQHKSDEISSAQIERVQPPEQQKLIPTPKPSKPIVPALHIPPLQIVPQIMIEVIPSPRQSPVKQQAKDSYNKQINSARSLDKQSPMDKLQPRSPEILPEAKPRLLNNPQNQNMRSSQRSESQEENLLKIKPQDSGFKHPQKTDRSNPRTPEVQPLKSPSIKPATVFKKSQPEKLVLDPKRTASVDRYSSSRKGSQIQVVESDQQQSHKPAVPEPTGLQKKQKRELFKLGHSKPRDFSSLFSRFQTGEQDVDSD